MEAKQRLRALFDLSLYWLDPPNYFDQDSAGGLHQVVLDVTMAVNEIERQWLAILEDLKDGDRS